MLIFFIFFPPNVYMYIQMYVYIYVYFSPAERLLQAGRLREATRKGVRGEEDEEKDDQQVIETT